MFIEKSELIPYRNRKWAERNEIDFSSSRQKAPASTERAGRHSRPRATEALVPVAHP